MVWGYIKYDESYANNKYTLSFAQDTFSVFYQKEKYFTGNKVKILTPINYYSKRIMKYFTSSFQKSLNSFSWGVGSTIETIGKIEIQLPIKEDGEIDFAFMETFISAIQKTVIKDVVLYADDKIEATKEAIEKGI